MRTEILIIKIFTVTVSTKEKKFGPVNRYYIYMYVIIFTSWFIYQIYTLETILLAVSATGAKKESTVNE